MFTQQDLALIHKAISEMAIKGADAPVIATLLTKITSEHTKITNPVPVAKKGK